MSGCACRRGVMCLLHFGELPRKKREQIRRQMGLRK